MRFEGKLTRDGRFWLAEIALLDALTQGRTRDEALEMIGDWLETMINREGFRAEARILRKNEFEVVGSDPAAMIALVERRRHHAS
jgi:predicted RNase H-like HicB family nuclease